MRKTSKVEINLNERGIGTVIVDGHNLSHSVIALSYVVNAGDLPTLTLVLSGVEVAISEDASVDLENQ